MSKERNQSERFEQYLKRQMGSEESHAFEREVFDDPFSLEALEGFEYHGSEVWGDLNKLKKQIKNREKKFFLFMRVAATVALLIIGSFLAYFFTDQMEGDQLAMEKKPMEEVIQYSPAPDTIPIPDDQEWDVADETPVAEEALTDTFKKDPLKVTDKDDKVAQLAITNDKEEIAAESVTEIVLVELSEKDELPTEDFVESQVNNLLQGRAAGVQITETNVAANPILPDTAQLDKGVITAQLLVARKETLSYATSDVEEEPSGKGKKAKAFRSATVARKRREYIPDPEDTEQESSTFTSAKPIAGDSTYQQYLMENLIYPKTAKQNQVKGVVELELLIDSNGNISDINIEKSLGYGCDQEAIRLVQDGPEWKPAEKDGNKVDDKVRVKVEFKL